MGVVQLLAGGGRLRCPRRCTLGGVAQEEHPAPSVLAMWIDFVQREVGTGFVYNVWERKLHPLLFLRGCFMYTSWTIITQDIGKNFVRDMYLQVAS